MTIAKMLEGVRSLVAQAVEDNDEQAVLSALEDEANAWTTRSMELDADLGDDCDDLDDDCDDEDYFDDLEYDEDEDY